MRGYYVDLVRGSGKRRRVALLVGPFATHAEALDHVSEARRVAYDIDPWSWSYPIGTCSIEQDDPLPVGKLNARLGVSVVSPGALLPGTADQF